MKRTVRALLGVGLLALPLQPLAPNPLIDRATADLAKQDGLAAEQDIWAARRSGASVADTHHLMANAYLLQGDAIKALQEASPDQISPAFAAYAAHVRIKADVLRNDLAAANNELTALLAQSPKDAAAWADLARTRVRSGDVGGAADAARRALLLDPHNSGALMVSAQLTRDREGLVAAVAAFSRVFALDPHNVPALLERAAAEGDLGRASAALADTRAAFALEPKNAQAFYLQAVLAARAGHYDLARSLLYHCSPSMDDVPAVLLLNGVIEFQSGNNEQAISAFGRLVTAQPHNFTARHLLAAVYAAVGDDDSVIETLKPLTDRPDADSYGLMMIARAYEDVDDRVIA